MTRALLSYYMPRWWAWLSVAASVVMLALVVIATVVVEPERTLDHWTYWLIAAPPLLAAFVGYASVAIVFGVTREFTELEAALPLPAKRLLLTKDLVRISFIATLMFLLFEVQMLALFFFDRRVPSELFFTVSPLLSAVAWAAFGIALVSGLRRRYQGLWGWVDYVLPLGAGIVGMYLGRSLLSCGLGFLCAAAMLAVNYRLAETDAALLSSPTDGASRPSGKYAPWSWRSDKTVSRSFRWHFFRTAFGPRYSFFAYFFIALWLSIAILSYVRLDYGTPLFMYFVFLLAITTTLQTSISTSLPAFTHLPLSRGRLFRWLVVPVVCGCAVLASLSVVGGVSSDTVARVESRPGNHAALQRELLARADFWRLSEIDPPLITSPTGEAFRPTSHPTRLGGLLKYNPYEVPANASDAFLVHQLTRLLKDCCDISAASDEIHRRYLSKDSLRSVNYREFARETNPIPWKRLAAWGLFAAWFAVGGFIIVGSESHWAKVSKARRIVERGLWLIGFLTLYFFFWRAHKVASPLYFKTLPSDMDLIIGIGIQWLANNLSIVIAVEALGGLALWTLIRRLFDRAELVRAIKPGPGQAMLDITHI